MADDGNTTTLPITKTFLVCYGLFVALLYQYAFWHGLGVNILQYANPFDVLKAALWPLFLLGILYCGGVFLPALLFDMSVPTPSPKSGFTGTHKFFIFSYLVGAVVAFVLHHAEIGWLLIVGACGSAVSIRLEHRIQPIGVPTKLHRSFVVALTAIPFLVWIYGILDIDVIRKGESYTRATLPSETLRSAGIAEGADLRLLGTAGGSTFFLVDSGPQVLVLSNNSFNSLMLTKVQKP
jgi:hypothetical protein